MMYSRSKQKVYIADIVTKLPKVYNPEIVAEIVYPKSVVPENVHRLVAKSIRSIGIKNRPFVRSMDSYPEKELLKEEYHPFNLGKEIIGHFLTKLDSSEIGHFGVSYNVTSHKDFLPNLACQLSSAMDLHIDNSPEEIPYLGCAAAIYSIRNAVEYCQKSNKAAIIYNFDQCSWLCNPVFDTNDPDFAASLKANLIFSDGAVGALIIPETMRDRFDRKLMNVIDVRTGYEPGAEIRMINGRFLISNNVKSVMPELVSKKLLIPMLKDNELDKSDISEWSIHQGGKPILESFMEPEILGLTSEQIRRSMDLYLEYGNFSSPSSIFALDTFFKEDSVMKSKKDYGVVVGFGAGYYLSSLLYNWD